MYAAWNDQYFLKSSASRVTELGKTIHDNQTAACCGDETYPGLVVVMKLTLVLCTRQRLRASTGI